MRRSPALKCTWWRDRRRPISIPRAHTDIHLDAGEAIWTESSYKYAPEQIAQLLRSVAFEPIAQWIDEQDGFALTLAKAA
jgi:uncharacterized SAM-dependent methyltransferase